MNRFLSTALLVPAAIVATLPATAVAQAPNTFTQVSQHLRAVESMTADFVQTDRNGKALGGKLSLKRPGKVRFQYEKGVPLLIVGDGRALTMIDYQVRQVSRWPIGNSPLSVLLDPSKDLSKVATVVPSGDPNLLLVAARDAKHPEFGTTTIAFQRTAGAPAGLMLQGWSVLDAQNNRSTVRLSNQKFGVAIPDQTFRFVDPRPRTAPGR